MHGFREAARWGLRIATTLGIVVYILVDVDRGHLWEAITGVQLPWVAAAVGVYLAGQALSSLKWMMLGHSVGLPGSYREYSRFYFTGMFFKRRSIAAASYSPITIGNFRSPSTSRSSMS